jgi:hypothetical protein
LPFEVEVEEDADDEDLERSCRFQNADAAQETAWSSGGGSSMSLTHSSIRRRVPWLSGSYRAPSASAAAAADDEAAEDDATSEARRGAARETSSIFLFVG